MSIDEHSSADQSKSRPGWWKYLPALGAVAILIAAGLIVATTVVWAHFHPPPDCQILMREYVEAFEHRLREPGAAMEPGDGRDAYARLEEAGCTTTGDAEL